MASDFVEYKPKALLVFKTTGIESVITWKLLPENGQTRVTFTGEYTIPTTLFTKFAEPVLIKLNEHEAEALVANLKVRLEAAIPVEVAHR